MLTAQENPRQAEKSCWHFPVNPHERWRPVLPGQTASSPLLASPEHKCWFCRAAGSSWRVNRPLKKAFTIS